MKQKAKKFLFLTVLFGTLFGVFYMNAFAKIDYNTEGSNDDYYNVISKKDWTLAPGIEETEVVLNNDEGSLRQVVHSVKVDMNNSYTKVIPGYKGMIPTEGNYGTESTSTQAKNAEALGYGNVVAATNAMLSWYNNDYYKANPQLIGEPLYYSILDGYYYENSNGPASFSKNYATVVINYDYHPLTGEPRPVDIPKVAMRAQTDSLTGWEQNAVSVWGWLVKPDANGVPRNVYTNENHTSGFESRTFVGVTAEGEIILSVVDGRQAPYSSGFNMYEMGDYMLKMGCVYAANCDGGGSTTFVSQRPGEDLKVNCSLSDGGERPTTNTFLVISTAPSDGEFSFASIDSAYDYYTPFSSIEFSVLGTDSVGNKVDIPSDVTWKIKEDGMGTIENQVFVSNGNEGKVTVQMIYKGEVVGEKSINIVIPDRLSFSQPIVTIPYGKKAIIPIKASYGGGLYEIGLSSSDVSFTSSNSNLGFIDGLHFVGANRGDVADSSTTHIVATLNSNAEIKAEVDLKLGEASIVMWDFENGQEDIDEWNSIVLRNPGEDHRDFYHSLSLADKTNGEVHNGNYSMRLETNGLSSKDVHSKQYAYVRLGLKDQTISLENARSIGFWLYVPEDNIQCWVQGFYKYDTNGDGVPDTLAEVNLMNSEYMYYNVDESGWHYLSMDISDYEKIDLAYSSPFDSDPSDGSNTGDTDEFFLVLIFHKSINNILWATNGSINGPFTYYIDNITVDYSEVVEDREAPIIESVIMNDIDGNKKLVKHSFVTTTSNLLSLTANVTDATYRVDGTGTKHSLANYTGLNASSAKAYVDGVEVASTYEDGKISIADIAVADGFHRIKFEICDNAGNMSTVVRLIEVKSGIKASTIKVVPADPKLVEEDRLKFGSVFWMKIEATNIETIKEISTVIDLNNVNHWELDHMVTADGFSSSYTIDDETNTATIKLIRAGENYQVGNAVLAYIPIRLIYFDTDMNIPGYTAETVWTSYNFWPQDLKVDVDMGEITYVDGYTPTVLGTFSNLEFQINTEMYTDFQSMGSDPYFTEHETTHVHVPVAGNKKATCTEFGYIGGTYCEVCNSPIEWGEVVAPTGHFYKVENDSLVCECGHVLTGTQVIEVNGFIYFMIADKLQTGWQNDGNDWYYLNTDYTGVDGKMTINGVEFEFDNGKLLKGVWVKDEIGSRYWYGPAYYICKNGNQNSNVAWYEINEQMYGFDKNGYRHEGIKVLVESSNPAEIYEFTNEGVLLGVYVSNYSGIFQCNGQVTYLINGRPTAPGLIRIDDDFYYFNSGCIAVTGYYKISRPNNLLPSGFYQFDDNGKMINPPVDKNGPMIDGTFYINGVRQLSYQIIKYQGDYFFIDEGNLYLVNTTVYLSEKFLEGTNLVSGRYTFGPDGKMLLKNGPQEDGTFFINGVQQLAYKLIEYQGNYYFIDRGNRYLTDITLYISSQFMGDTCLPANKYSFGSDGKMVLKNGPQEDGTFYIDGIQQFAYKLIEFEGDYYFIDRWNKYLKNITVYLGSQFFDGTSFKQGNYTFGTDGKMKFKNGPQEDGTFYIDGIQQFAYKLIEFEGDYYFIDRGNKYLKEITVYLSTELMGDTGLPANKYVFGHDGKMIYKNGPQEDGTFYINGVQQFAYKLIEFEEDYYFIDRGNKYLKDITVYLSTELIGEINLPSSKYAFGSDGKMVLKNGPQEDGTFYINGVQQLAYKLVVFEGNYYFIDRGNKYLKEITVYLSTNLMGDTELPSNKYTFDCDGKMQVKDGPQVDGTFYINGVQQLAYKLIEYNGNYYFIDNGNKFVTNTKFNIKQDYLKNTYLLPGYYEFGPDGKMMGHIYKVPNLRDIGDIPFLKTTDGKDIKSGLFIRGPELDNTLQNFTEEQRKCAIEALKNVYRVNLDLDLRYLHGAPYNVLGDDIIHKFYDMVYYDGVFTLEGKQKVRDIFKELANKENYPVYLHCTYGADRAGTISYILELLLGVSEENARREYLISIGSYGQYILKVRDGINKYSGSTIKDRTATFLLDCGVTQDEIDSIRDIYIEQ